MSAFGQDVGSGLAIGYAKAMERFVWQQIAKERAWLEERLRELEPGGRNALAWRRDQQAAV